MAATSAQFNHVSTYSRSASSKAKVKQWTVKDIISEANRDPEHSQHVENPLPPVHLSGCAVEMLEEELEKFLDQQENKLAVKTKNGVQYRKAAKDGHVLLAAVYSWPEHLDYYDKDRFETWKNETLEWHEKTYGKVNCAVAHFDESFPHIHVYTFAPDAKMLVPGNRAKKEVAAAGGDVKEQNRAYRAEMKLLQDSYFAEVGAINGLDRLGPGRKRLTRKEWREGKQARLEAADALRAQKEKAENLTAQALAAVQALTEEREAVAQRADQLAEKERVLAADREKLNKNYNEKRIEIKKREGGIAEEKKLLKLTKEKLASEKAEIERREFKVEKRENRIQGMAGVIAFALYFSQSLFNKITNTKSKEQIAFEEQKEKDLKKLEFREKKVNAKESEINSEEYGLKMDNERLKKEFEQTADKLAQTQNALEAAQALVQEQAARLKELQPSGGDNIEVK